MVEKDLPFACEIVDLGNKPPEFKALYRAISPDPTARAKVPVLEVGAPGSDEHLWLLESAVVARYVARRWADRGTPLLPDDAADEARMELFLDTCNSRLTPCTYALMAAKDTATLLAKYEDLVRALVVVDRCLTVHCLHDGDFVLGQRYSLAEVMTAPFVVRMLASLRGHRGVDVLALADELCLPRLGRWLQAVQHRPSTTATTPAPNSLAVIAPYLEPFFVGEIAAEDKAAVVARVVEEMQGSGEADEQAWATAIAQGKQAMQAKRQAKRQEEEGAASTK